MILLILDKLQKGMIKKFNFGGWSLLSVGVYTLVFRGQKKIQEQIYFVFLYYSNYVKYFGRPHSVVLMYHLEFVLPS